MKKTFVLTALILAVSAGIALAHSNRRTIREFLSGVQEVPVVSTTGSGTFRAEISKDGDEIEYTVTPRRPRLRTRTWSKVATPCPLRNRRPRPRRRQIARTATS